MNDEATHEVFEDEVQNWRDFEDACSAGFRGSRFDYLLEMLHQENCGVFQVISNRTDARSLGACHERKDRW